MWDGRRGTWAVTWEEIKLYTSEGGRNACGWASNGRLSDSVMQQKLTGADLRNGKESSDLVLPNCVECALPVRYGVRSTVPKHLGKVPR